MSTDFLPLTENLFIGLTIFLFFMVLVGLKSALVAVDHSNQKIVVYLTVLGLGGWLCLIGVLGSNGFFSDLTVLPPKIMGTVLACVIFIVTMASLKAPGKLLDAIPESWLIYPQVFRILMEIILWQLFLNQNCPEQMTFEGLNFDIVAGITAPIVAFACFGQGRRLHKLALAWNFLSLALLLTIMAIAILSTPAIGKFDSPNLFIGQFPFVWLPAFVAPLAMFMHVMSIRQLVRKMKMNN